MDETILLVALVLFFSSLVRTIFGFGDALIAMPLLSLLMPVKSASPIVAVFALIISLYILKDSYREVDFKSILTIVIFSVLSIPLGVIFLSQADERLVKFILGLVLILFGLFKLFKPNLFHLKSERYAPIFAIISGALGGAYNTNGPPIIIYGTLRKWDSAKFRATLQGVFLPVNSGIIVSHLIGGLWTKSVAITAAYSIPILFVAIFLGTFLAKRINQDKFLIYVYILLIALGLLMFF